MEMVRRNLHLLLTLAALVLVAVVAQRLGGSELLLALPALALLVPLAAGRYVGEERLARLVQRRAGRATRTVSRALVPRTPRAPRVVVPRGGRLIASRLAERGPPALAAAR
ncbi:MAG: hypothetical protein QOI62_345 [Solirubrobacteraceae bacterium]|nr:hypothetical protein [Solirubrobacteraceae bacterium]